MGELEDAMRRTLEHRHQEVPDWPNLSTEDLLAEVRRSMEADEVAMWDMVLELADRLARTAGQIRTDLLASRRAAAADFAE
jgi:hypothetical protein